MIESRSRRSPEKVPKWDLTGTEGCGGGKVISLLPRVFSGYKSIYRRKKWVGGATRGPRGWGARLPPGRPPAPWPPRCVSDFHAKSPGLRLFQERSSRSFRSVWILFDIHFLRNTEIGRKTTICFGPSVNRLVPKIV